MSKVDCDVINDLMPSYIDGICSKSSKSLVEDHLVGCEACRNLADMMKTTELVSGKSDVKEIDYMKKVKKYYLNHIWFLSLLVASMIIGMTIVIRDNIMIPIQIYYIILPVIMISGYFVLVNYKPKKQGKGQKLATALGILMVGYSVALQMISINWAVNGHIPFGLEIHQLGPFLYKQFMLVSFYHVFVFILSLFQYTRDERSYDILLSVSALGVSLALAFISILKNLTSLDHLTVIRKQTIFVLIIEAIIMTGLFYLINRKRTEQRQDKKRN